MPLPLFIGLLALFLSLAIPPIIKIVRDWIGKPNPSVMPHIVASHAELDRLNGQNARGHLWGGYASAEEQESAQMEQARFIQLGQIASGTLSTHRLQCIVTAIKLASLHKRFGPRPLIDPKYRDGTPNGIEEGLKEFYTRTGPWETKFHTAYATEFHGQIVNLVHGFGNEGIANTRLNRLLLEEVDADAATLIADLLVCLALRTEGLRIIVEGAI